MRLSFKKNKRETGRVGIGYPYPSTDIKVDRKVVGHIIPPTWQTKNNTWSIQIAVEKDDIHSDGNANCPWRWVFLKLEFDEEKDAREYLKNHTEGLFSLPLHYFD
jgi:hypothetical protein